MTLHEHYVLAYFSVMTELSGDIPLRCIRDLEAEFVALFGQPSSVQGQMICAAFEGISWDWPAWQRFAMRDGDDPLPVTLAMIAAMSPGELLEEGAKKTEVRELCKKYGVELPHRALKSERIAALREVLGPEKFSEIANPFGEILKARAEEDYRQQMAMAIASRISSVAHYAYHYEQLTDPDSLVAMPYWRFVWVEDVLSNNRHCKRYDGQTLPAKEAMATFPRLPCDHLRCCCYLVGKHKRV